VDDGDDEGPEGDGENGQMSKTTYYNIFSGQNILGAKRPG